MKKNYVLDTNVVLYDPQSIHRFEDNNVVIPIYVIEEVDKFKHESSERGRNARQISRSLDHLRTEGSLMEGAFTSKLPGGGLLQIVVPAARPELVSSIDMSTMDAAILQMAITVRKERVEPTIFVTMDCNLRIRAAALGMQVQTYESNSVSADDLGTGTTTVQVRDEDIESFFQEGQIPLNREDIPTNSGVYLVGETEGYKGLGRYDASVPCVRSLRVPREGVMDVRPRNREQSLALDLLLDPKIRLVTLVGSAGTGKTVLAVAAGLKMTLESAEYTRVLVSRPVMAMGKDLGYLPGTIEEKLNPWMQPIFDNLDFIFSREGSKKKSNQSYADLMESGMLQVEPLTYIRGRSLPQQYFIVDEAQNLTPHEVKTIITRAGDGTKIVLTGDPGQIDNPYVDSASNGLTVAADRFRGQACAGHIVLTQGERSELADLASKLL